ncbi:MarR family transcriptional regulator [Caldinitratiruptor microaerophilus]|uniref:MarR family transcriptional regulator n=1 Tax=Caldinitratiruptor microaerophilus TaxID=671077 RepID=A0AA35CLP2_9FIRM|nr:MarR family transcriptional regulator [Caldinitratiruptor microaerophilus]
MVSNVEPSEDRSTRREIIYLLRTAGPLTVSELGERLGITHVAVRRHLTALERDDLVTSTLMRQPMGRPTRLYSLTEAADDLFPKKYSTLAVEMVDFMAEQAPDQRMVDEFFARRWERLTENYGPQVTRGKDVRERVARLAELQAANGYLASWEKGDGPGEFVLREFNCPVHAVSRKYPQACKHELKFFKTVLGTDQVERVECIADGQPACKYVIRTPHAAEATPEESGPRDGH